MSVKVLKCSVLTPKVTRYSPETDAWTELKPMKYGRNGCAVGAVEDHIFAVGGCRSDGTVLHSIERYNTNSDQWSSVGLMQVFIPTLTHTHTHTHTNTHAGIHAYTDAALDLFVQREL